MFLSPEVVLGALAAYALVVVGAVLWNARERRLSRRLDEAGPTGHVLHESRAQALIRQVFGRDR